MTDYKVAIGALTLLIGMVSYSFYFRDFLKGKTKPDAYSWLIWGVLASIIFFAQSTNGGGAGSWATALTAVVCFIIAAVALESFTPVTWLYPAALTFLNLSLATVLFARRRF